MRPKKYQPARLAQVLIASALIFSALAISVPLTGVSSPSLIDARLFSGAGDQSAAKATFSSGQLFVAYNNVGSFGLVGKFATTPGLPQVSAAAPAGSTSFAGITPNPAGGVFAVGGCFPPACGAQDFVGGTEGKIGISSVDAGGNLVFAKSANIFAYRGTEALVAATSAIEGGATVVYAAGYGEPCSNALNIFVKFDAFGNVIAKATEPDLQANFFGYCAVGVSGSAAADDLVVTAAGIYFAGASANRPGDDGVLRPVIYRYDTNLNRLAKYRYADVAGQLLAITESGGALYAAGFANAGTQQYLIQKYDLNGNRVWSQIFGGTGIDIFYDVIVVNGRLFAVGKSNSPGTNAFDGIITEFDPSTGNTLAGNTFGAPLDQSLNGVTTDGTDLFVAGETRVSGGNANEAVLLRYSLAGPSATATAVIALPNPSMYGQSVAFTAIVTSGATPVTQGSVTFKEGGLTVSGPTNLDASGKATYNASSLSVGSHTITAEYSGDPAFTASSGSTTQTINKANTNTALSSNVNPSVIGQSVTFTATVTPVAPGAGTPAGSVQFRDGGFNIGFAVPLVNGVASIQTSQLGIGPHSISADYFGDSGFNPSTGNVSQTINKGDTMTTVSSSPNPSQSGQGITFSATVTAKSPAAGVPTGSVQFKDNGSPFGGPTPVNLGVATSFPFNLGVGTHTITAEFSGDFSFNPSSGSSSHVVNKADTATTLTSFQNPSNATQFASFVARVVNVAQPFTPINEGTVTLNEGGAVVAGPFAVDGAGNANFNLSTLGAGTHLLTAQYSGSNNFNPSGSAVVTQTVNALTPFININTGGFATYDGNPHPATATANGQNNAPVNGTFTFTYSPGGSSEPVNAGAYGVTATFTSNDPNYSNAVASVGPTPGGGTWSTRASLPNARYGPPSAVINNKIYVAGGCCVGGGGSITRFNALDVYDQQNNSWTSKAPIPIGVYGAGAAAINGIFYVVAGQQDSGNINNVQAYDPVGDSWSVKTPMPDASGGVGAAVVNNRIYVIGGMNPSNTVPVNLVRQYDPSTNLWTPRAAMTTPRVFMGVAAQNNRIYVVGGYSSGGSPLSTLEVYDTNSNTWSTKAPMPTARYGLTVEFLNGTLYAIGGNGGVGGVYEPLATVETYDPNTDTWSTLAPAPETHYLAGGGQVFGTLYLMGGLDANGLNSGRNDAFSPDRLLRINKRQPQLTVTGGTFPYNAQPHPAIGTATGVNGTAVAGTFAFNYSPGGSLAPVTPNFYSAFGTFTSADPNYQSGGSAFGNIQITRPAAIVDVPSDITVEAHGGDDGAQVSFVVGAHDVDGPVAANCSPSSGSFFHGGMTTVNCTAQGLNSSQGFGSFHVTVNVPTLESIAVTTDDGESTASVNVNQTKQFVATATFSDGETQSTADQSGGSGNGGGGSGGGSGSGGSGGGGSGFTPSVGFWNIHFTPGLNVSACGGGGGVGFSSQNVSVDSTGLINNTQWSPQTPTVNVTGQVTTNVGVTLTLTCINNASITTTANLPWQTTSFDGSITFSGQTTQAHVTGWSSQPSMPTPAFASGAATIGNKLYVVGGGVNGAPSGLVQVFDLTTRTWLAPAASMSPREGPGVAALNGYIYAAGGHMPGGNATSILQRYDPTANQWATLAPMPGPRAELQLVAAGGMLYAIGGETGNGSQPALATVERYDPVGNAWVTLAPMGTPRMFFAAGALNNETTIIVAGNGSGGLVSSVELYNIATNTWSATTPLQTTMAAGATIANRFYVATACGTFVYRPAGGPGVNEGWAIMPNMLNPRGEFAVAVSGEVMYAAGGFTGSGGPTTSVATFDALSTPSPSDLFYSGLQVNANCGSSGGGGDDDDDDGDGPTWRIVDPITHQDSTIASIDETGLATGVSPGTVLVVAEVEGVSCLDSNECATLTVVDAEPPTITAPADITAEATSPDGAIVDPGHALANDNFGPVTITRLPAGNQFAIGTTPITWRATDGAGNFSEAISHVTVVDTTAPGITAPADVTAEATSANGAVVDPGVASGSDLAGAVTITRSPAGNQFLLGTTTITWRATDAGGNFSVATSHVTVVDTTSPGITAPPDVTAEATSANGAVVDPGIAIGSDFTDPVTITRQPAGNQFALGTTPIIWRATDGAGNFSEATSHVTVVDTTAPGIAAPADVIAEATSANGSVVDPGVASGSDLVGPVTITRLPAGNQFAIGTTPITWRATDGAGNFSEVISHVTVVDTTSPGITAPADVTAEATSAAGAVVDPGVAIGSDLAGAVIITRSPAGNQFAVGTTPILWTATDANGNFREATSHVTVVDTTSPSITAPAAVTAEATGADGAIVEPGQATASDLAGPVTITRSPLSDQFALGTSTITWRATDGTGNFSEAIQHVTVVDTTAPPITAPADVTAEATSADGAVVDPGQASGSDLVGPVTITRSPEGNQFALGTSTITWRATDGAGNFSEAIQHVTVVDTTSPSITAPAAVTAEATSADGAVVEPGQASGGDLVGAVTITRSPESNQFALGMTTITWRATDGAGNFSEATQHVTVVDTTSPSITAPANVTAEATGADGAIVGPGQAIGSDLVGLVTITRSPEGNQFALGTTPITWRATDAAGNFSEATQHVTVVDTTSPVMTVPADITTEATGAAGASVDPGQATGSDLVSPVTITRSPAGNQFAIGTTTITWRATDGAGNFVEAAQHVTVVDTTLPVLNLPGSITVDATNPQGAIVTYAASATDGVGGSLAVTCSTASGSMFAIGTTTVTCSATDAASNTAIGSFTVLVQAAAAQVSQLIVTVQTFNLQQGISNSLDAKLTNVLAALNGATTGNSAAVCNQLGAFINETNAQSGKKLTVAQANQLIAAAQQIQAVLGCQ